MLKLDVQETLAIVREAFDDLDGFSDDRITFHAKFSVEEVPIRLMDAVWSSLASRPPVSISVRIKDGPGEAAASESSCQIPTGYWLTGSRGDERHESSYARLGYDASRPSACLDSL